MGEYPISRKHADTCCWRCFDTSTCVCVCHSFYSPHFFCLLLELLLSRSSLVLSLDCLSLLSTLSPLSFSLGFPPKTNPLSSKPRFFPPSLPLSLDAAFVLPQRSIHRRSMESPHEDSRQSRLLVFVMWIAIFPLSLSISYHANHPQTGRSISYKL